MSIKLSIIIPCYNAEPYIYELLTRIQPQITKEVEVILIDDGSKIPVKADYEWLKLIRQRNAGISKARNKGLEMAKGELIWFIDADDLIADNAIETILDALKHKEFDYIDLSWKSLEDDRFIFRLHSDNDSLSNPSACTRVFKRSFIGNTRFPEKKDASEDEDFTRHLGIRNSKHISITEFMYYYRTETPGSNSKRFLNDERETKRIGYYFKHITKDMTYLIDEIKKEDEVNEVFVLTFQNDLPELEKYCQIWCPPRGLRVMESRGEPNKYFSIIPRPMRTQVVLFRSEIDTIGGIETFIYSFCKQMSKYYDITVVYDAIANEQLGKLVEICPVVKNNPAVPIFCDTLIVNSINEQIPRNISYKKSVQMVHCTKQNNWRIPQDRDYIVNVSQASKDSFGEEAKDGIVIHNLTATEKTHKALLLVSALRVGADDKRGNDARCIKFAHMLENAGIEYIWIYFGNRPMRNAPESMIYGGLKQNIKPYIAKADYLVQLSGAEAFSYSLLESLEQHTPVIVTPLEQNKDMGIIDGENAYIVPFEVDGFDVKKILKIPKFDYKHDNAEIVKQWRKLLGNSKPKGDYKPKKEVTVEVIREYRDMQLNELMKVKTRCKMKFIRALELQNLGFVRMVE
jgi:hypothetical protein